MLLFCQSYLLSKKVQCVLLKLLFFPENVCLIEKEVLQVVEDLKTFNSVKPQMKIFVIKNIGLILLQYMTSNFVHHGKHLLTPSKMGWGLWEIICWEVSENFDFGGGLCYGRGWEIFPGGLESF